jgi:tetratricopeptide (TPR) repeat protein
MYRFPTDPKKIRQRIRRYERSLRKDPPHGLRDGYGKRYLLGPLYLMLGNVQDTLDHYKWYQDAYPDDSGYALNFLCWAITLYRNGDIEEAEEKLISTVLSNVFLIPFILGHKIPTLDSWEDRYYNELMEIEGLGKS